MLWKIFLRPSLLSNIISKSLIKDINIFTMPFYAVAKGRTAGIYMTWPDCEAQVKGFPGARYKKFDSVVAAQEFITTGGDNKTKPSNQKSNVRSSLPNNTTNLKRNFSTSAPQQSNDDVPKKKPKSNRKSKSSKDSDSEMSDDLNDILIKQMDDIEKRLKGFGKGVDKIIKKSTKGERKSILIEPQGMRSESNNDGEDFKVDENGYVQVYTDGACSSNGRNGARAGLGVYWGEGHSLNTSKPVSGRATNNCGEIQAATEAIRTAIDNGITKLAINTDSKFLINSVTKWITGWKRKGWKLASGEPVKNEKDFKELDSIQNKIEIKWVYVEAHRGIHGNEMADQLAKAGAAMYNI